MWMNGSRSLRLTPANARRTGNPSPSKPGRRGGDPRDRPVALGRGLGDPGQDQQVGDGNGRHDDAPRSWIQALIPGAPGSQQPEQYMTRHHSSRARRSAGARRREAAGPRRVTTAGRPRTSPAPRRSARTGPPPGVLRDSALRQLVVGQRGRRHDAEHGPGERPHGEVVRRAAGPLGQRLRHQVHHPAGVVENPGADLRHRHLQRERLAQLLHLLGSERRGDLAQRGAQRGDRAELRLAGVRTPRTAGCPCRPG